VPLVEYVKAQGCQVEVITFGRSASSRLREAVDDFIDMDENPKDFLIGYRGGPIKRNGGLKRQLQKIVGTDTDDL
jgi:uncharacterized LabA/DUF88 family protein